MRIGMALRVVNDFEIFLQVGYLQSGFGSKRMILAKADHKPISAQRFELHCAHIEKVVTEIIGDLVDDLGFSDAACAPDMQGITPAS